MDSEQIETFIDLMETRSFNRSAERLGVAQSVVSHRIKALEKAVGKRLFHRSRAGTVPTIAGSRMLDHALTLRRSWAEARRQVAAVGEFEHAMRVGLQHDIADAFAGRIASSVRESLPDTGLYLEVDYSRQMIADLSAGELDIAVVYSLGAGPDLHVEALGELNYVMVEAEGQGGYVFPNHSPHFARAHLERYPDLAETALSCGQSRAIRNLLEVMGGRSFISEPTALAASDWLRRLEEPPIGQPIYLMMALRNRHVPTHRKIANILRKLLQKEGPLD